MDHSNIIECGGFYFIHNFDSGNLGHVERVPTELIATSINSKTNSSETPDYEFNLWTRPDCAGTEFENGNRTWFYFGVQAPDTGVLVRLNLINLNKQGKMYNQGMAPVTRTLPGKPQWERIRDRPIHSTDDNTFTLSFKYRTADNVKATTFFAFTYPFSFAELQIALNSIDMKMLPLPPPQSPDDIYYCRECLIYSLEGRRVDLLTISSFHGITNEREERLKNLFPDKQERPFKFQNKKIIFISARVHPGETPSSFVFNGFLNLLLTRNDPIATQLRKHYVFKMIPFLNPDGVARGHYRTDTRGVNLNRVYLNPSLVYHPTVYASRALIRYYHFGCEKEDLIDDSKSFTSRSIQNINESIETLDPKKTREKKSHSPYKTSEYYKRDKPGKLVITNKSSTTIKQPSNISENSRQITVEHVHLVDQGMNVDKRFKNEANDKSGKSVLNKNKSSTSIKQPTNRETKKNLKVLTGESRQLVEQVYDMKLQEQPSQTSNTSSKPSVSNIGDNTSLLNDNTLRTCLGSSVHLSTSEELNIPGTNPLRPLRDTLKNSISLLMESNSSIAGESMTAQPTHPTNVKIGWCQECRMAVSRLEDTMPGITNMVPGYNLSLSRQENLTYHTIDEYREVQKQKTDEHERNSPTYLSSSPTPESSQKEDLYFCTNCFKRYVITESNEEIKVSDIVSRQSIAVSAGDSGVVRGETHAQQRAGSTGDALPLAIHQTPEKPKSAVTKGAKKKPAPPPTFTPTTVAPKVSPQPTYKEPESGLYLYIDLHGHASKKGIFMYGNHFDDLESCVECMLLPRIMSLNNLHFHFSSCNFTERNMYLKDRRDGMSREGSGRVAVLKATGLVRSYTLECNYNTGRLVNVLPPARADPPALPPHAPQAPHPPHAPHPAAPPKYTPHIFEEIKARRGKNLEVLGDINPKKVGRSLGASILDLTGQHPNSRIPCSEHRNLAAVRDWLRAHTRTMRPQLTMSRLRPKTSSPARMPLYARSKGKVTEERKENTYAGAKLDERARPDTDKFAKKNEPVITPSRTRYFAENDPKPKTLAAKRRNAFDIRKPESSKIRVGGVAKVKSGRVADAADMSRTSSAKLRTFGRTSRGGTRSRTRLRGTASSSSEDVSGAGGVAGLGVVGGSRSSAAWEAPPKRRPPPARPPSLLKKIRLKAAL